MTTTDKIKQFSNRGYFSFKQCHENKISRYELSLLLNKGIVRKVKYGLYSFSDVLEDELYIPQVFSDKVIYSNETALYLNGFSDQIPFTYTITVPKGYHSKQLWDNFIVRQVSGQLFGEGIMKITSSCGNPIKVYCIERTLCDLIKNKIDFDKERYIPAVQKYMASKDKDMYKIMEYAKMLNVEKKIRPYLEVLL